MKVFVKRPYGWNTGIGLIKQEVLLTLKTGNDLTLNSIMYDVGVFVKLPYLLCWDTEIEFIDQKLLLKTF